MLAKCDETTCTTLTTDVTALKGCMTDPSASSCTDTYGVATNLNTLVDAMSKCMTDPTAGDCASVYPIATTLPKVTKSLSMVMAVFQTVSQVLNSHHNNKFRL